MPVLPAMSQPLIWAWVPVPWATTSRSIWSISPSGGLAITWAGRSGPLRQTTTPLEVEIRWMA